MKYALNLGDEIMDGYHVSSEMKKVWKAQLDLLDKFQQVCEKYKLPYFASGGTLLGAVRHKGYIPWDDDIDIHMLANDYEKFCKVAPKELQPYFWQEYRTEKGYYPWHGKIRNSQTTGCTQWERKNWPDNMNKGIFIDIFPIYYLPKSKFIRKLQRFLLTEIKNRINLYQDKKFADIKKGEPVHYSFSYNLLCRLFMHICRWQKKPAQFVGANSFNCNEPRFIWPAANYRDTVDLPFMGGTIKAPIKWDACLKQQYGDYMEIVKNGSMHSDMIFDVDVPYKQKLSVLGVE